jgi:hypothetical protein
MNILDSSTVILVCSHLMPPRMGYGIYAAEDPSPTDLKYANFPGAKLNIDE